MIVVLPVNSVQLRHVAPQSEAAPVAPRRAADGVRPVEAPGAVPVPQVLGPRARSGLILSNAEGDARDAQAETEARRTENSQTERSQSEARPSEDQRANGDLTEEEQAQLRQLKARDAEVRRHEEAHATVGGQYAGSPSYTYQTGPDGGRYAIGGEVPIDVAPIPDDPAATIDKMEVVKAAALAPAEPSSADRRIAALADAQRLQAMADLAADRREATKAERSDAAEAGFTVALAAQANTAASGLLNATA